LYAGFIKLTTLWDACPAFNRLYFSCKNKIKNPYLTLVLDIANIIENK
jgi:hypothetical protein